MKNERVLSEDLTYMRRRFRPKNRLARGLIGAGPLVDVTLLILLFYIMHSAFVLQPGISIRLPEAPFVSGAAYGDLVVLLTQENLVFFNDERTTMQGLESAFAQAAHDNPESELVVQADGRVPQSRVVEIYNKALGAGLRKVTLATRSPAPGEP